EGRQGAVLGDPDQGAVTHAGLEGADDQAVVGEGVGVELDGAQAPVVVVVPLLVGAGLIQAVSLGRLEVVRPQQHAFVLVDCSGCPRVQRSAGRGGPAAGKCLTGAWAVLS